MGEREFTRYSERQPFSFDTRLEEETRKPYTDPRDMENIDEKSNNAFSWLISIILIASIIAFSILIALLWGRKNNNGFLIIDGMKTNKITKQDVLNYDNIYLINFHPGDSLQIAGEIGEKAYAKIFCNSDTLINTSFVGFFNIIEHGENPVLSGTTYDYGPHTSNTTSYRSKDSTRDIVNVDLSGFELSLYYDTRGNLTVYGLAYNVENLIVNT